MTGEPQRLESTAPTGTNKHTTSAGRPAPGLDAGERSGAPACVIEGARTHNLKGISVSIPFGRLTAIAGVSGSGKSTLAFDTLYAEGQRRFVDCLSTYARQFLPRLDRPDVDRIGRIQPPVALRQQTSVRNARSTVGSITELSDHLHLLLAYAGTVHCAECGAETRDLSLDDGVELLLRHPGEERLVLTAPVEMLGSDLVRGSRETVGSEAPLLAALVREGFSRIYRDGAIVDSTDPSDSAAFTHLTGDPEHPQPIAVVVDRFLARSLRRARAAESLETAWKLGHGTAWLFRGSAPSEPIPLLRGVSCPGCGRRAESPRPQIFSPDSSLGACPDCRGFGREIIVDREKVVPDTSKSLRRHAVVPFASARGTEFQRLLLRRGRKLGVPLDAPFDSLTEAQRAWVFEGDEEYPGVDEMFRLLEKKRYKAHVRIFLARYRGFVPCRGCGGARRRPEALAVRIAGRSLPELEGTSIRDLLPLLREWDLPRARRLRVAPVLRETCARLGVLEESGLGYLTLGRSARTLSGGETQRIRLAAGLGSLLTETLYILDEPTAGLHAADTRRMLRILRRLCRNGNTVVAVEHDPGLISGADHLIVLGPSGGEEGGELLHEGSVESFLAREPDYFRAITARGTARSSSRIATNAPDVTNSAARIATTARDVTNSARSRESLPPGSGLILTCIHHHNLRIPRLEIPLDRLVAITGVSGSGKSTLLDAVLYRNALRRAGRVVDDVGRVEAVEGWERLSEVLLVSQAPPGRSSRSTVGSLIGVLTLLRTALARTPRARELGLTPGSFSFNVPGGRCEACQGMGTVILEMHFMNDVEIACEACRGRRFRETVLEVTLGGRSILQILEMTAREAADFLDGSTEARRRLAPLRQVGLEYLRLGQATSTLSGGESQRLRIATFLAEARAAGGPKLFLLDEPTSGLHPKDIARLLGALRELLDRGHGVIAVEHQLDLIAAADHVIDLGPGAGDAGGRVVFEGGVPDLLRCKTSVTARELRASLRRRPIAAAGTDRRAST